MGNAIKVWSLGLVTVIAICSVAFMFYVGFHLTNYRQMVRVEHHLTIEDWVGASLTTNFPGNIASQLGRADVAAESYKTAEATLREQLDSWLAFLGIFGILFGLVTPLASYLLQQHSLEDERERMGKSLEDAKGDYNKKLEVFEAQIEDMKSGSSLQIDTAISKFDKDIADLKKDAQAMVETESTKVVADTQKKMKTLWRFVSVAFDRFLVDDSNDIDAIIKDEVMAFNYIAIFVLYVDLNVMTDTASCVVTAVTQFKKDFDRMLADKKLSKAIADRFSSTSGRSTFVKKADYDRVLGSESETYDWIKKFYSVFLPQKLKI